MAKYGKDYDLDDQEIDTQELSGIIKAEMDDARDFIDQVGNERSENTDYCLLYTSDAADE